MLNTAPYVLPNLAPAEDEHLTVVVMISVPETPAEDEFRTPPERHSHSFTSSNEEVDQDMEEEKTVDLSRDSDVFGCEFVDRDVKMLEEEDEGRVAREKRNGEDNVMDDEDHSRVLLSDCCEATRYVEPIVEMTTRTFDDAETDSRRAEGGAKVVDQLLYGSKDKAVGHASLNVRKLPASFCTGGSKGDGATAEERGICRVRNEKRDGAETSRAAAHSCSAGPGEADDGSGMKPSETNEKEETNQDEQTENILKVLGLLARPLRPVYTEKVDILGSAIRSGITFPRPSWWPEDSDDDSI